MKKANALALLYQKNSLSLYLSEINKFPLLEPQQEYMLAKRYKEHGDIKAAHELTSSHLRLATKVALSFRHYGLALADLISEANIGLMQAIKKFDPDKGFRLATYAIWWIKASVSEFILKSWSLVKIGTVATQKRLFYNLHKIKSRLGLYGETAINDETAEQISKMLGVSKRDVIEMEQRLSGDSSLNVTLSHDSKLDHQDMLVDTSESIEDRLEKSQELDLQKKMLREVMDTLSEREQQIVEKRFLLEKPVTLEDLGLEFGISRERVRQIETKAFEKIKSLMKSKTQALTY
ncbi:MAG: RNA polymerase sigma factor RpoH [Lactobacillales bacterium]|jgi:RNA polymerase sigma-32 factor|nr:RNA polymerase sigma factor RpoH [Lactobacillales bacterium]